MVNVGEGCFVNLAYVRDYIALHSLVVHGKFGLEANLWKFVPGS